jgi:apolipoprotein N-acyltransferase
MSWRAAWWFGVLAALATGALFFISLGVGPDIAPAAAPLATVAPVPLLAYALSSRRAWPVLLAAMAARGIGELNLAYAYPNIPLADLAFLLSVQSASYGLVVILTRWISHGAPAWLAVFSYPLLLASSEFLFSLASPHGNYGAMGYSLVDVLPLLQAASVGGTPALSFLVALPPMAVAVLFVAPERWRAIAFSAAAPMMLATAYGVWRLSQDYDGRARVALVAIDAWVRRAYESDEAALEAARAYADEVRALAAQDPDIVVLPEKQFGGGRDASASIAVFAAAADALNAPVVVGLDEVARDGNRINSARVLFPGGAEHIYLKRHFLPGAENGYASDGRSLVIGDRGVAICKDMDFPSTIRSYGQRDVRLMLVPAWDFVNDGRAHSRMAVVRAVEDGFALARTAVEGRLTISDRYGRIVAEAKTSRDKPVVVAAEVGLRAGRTIYVRLGDLFAWLAVGAASLLLGARAMQALLRARKQAPVHPA